MPNESLDVAIVGGGVAGVYAAWRFLTASGNRTVAVFEADDHIGGRLLSVTPPHIPNMKAELGGMRILPEVQPCVTQLIAALNEQATGADRIETFDFPVDKPDNIAYLRGVHLRLSDFTEQLAQVPYRLTFQEFGKTAGQLVIDALDQVIPGITNPQLSEAQRRQMAQEATFAGAPLYKQGFWEILLRVMSGEAYQLAVAAGGYQTTLSNWNAADAIPWFLSDFGVSARYQGFTNGFQQVPLLLEEFVRAAGGDVRLNTRVTGFEQEGDAIKLGVHGGDPVHAKALILAMPRRALELLAPNSPLLQDPQVDRLVRSVTPRPLFKLFTTYLEPWWLPAQVEEGRSTTDLPVRQTYYWPKDDGTPATQGRAMLMASYDDGINIGFWDGFRPKRGRGWRDGADLRTEAREMFRAGPQDTHPMCSTWYRYQAPAAMVAEVQRQLGEIHGLKYTPEPQDASFRDWGDDPFGGGWNSWNIGVQSWNVKEQILKPVPDMPVYICGEAYSDAQGWVEGALQTTDMMLEKYFQIGPLP